MVDKPPRLQSLDALRGLTIAGMILVNYAGGFPGMYAPLRHAAWDGFTPTDLVFPSFLFIVGAAMWYAFKSAQHKLSGALAVKILRRTVTIFAIGLALNSLACLDGSPLRIPGVLQRIALCYGMGAILCLTLSPRRLLWTSVAFLLGYWALLLALGGPEPLSLAGNAVRRLDLALLGPRHIYLEYGMPFDPEGLLSTLPALVNVIAGFLVGRLVDRAASQEGGRERAVLRLFLWGVPLFFFAKVWNTWLPINKPIWSSSYVLCSVGLDLMLLAFSIWIIDVSRRTKVAQPFILFGENPLFIYVLASGWEFFLYWIQPRGPGGAPQALIFWLNDHCFAPWLGPVAGGLAVALAHVTVFFLIASVLHRKKIIIKI